MIDVMFSPKWFYGKDILIDLISIIVLVAISYVTFRYFRLNKRKKQHLMFSGSFALLGIAFLFKSLTNFTLYQHITTVKEFGIFTLTYHTIQYSDTLFMAGTLLYRLLTLSGLYILFTLYHKQPRQVNLLMFFFIFVVTYFTSNNYYIFHITSFLFLAFIVKKYCENYVKTKDHPAKFVSLSFIIILLSQLAFIFIGMTNMAYVIAEITQLIGYILLMLSFIMVLRYGKKK